MGNKSRGKRNSQRTADIVNMSYHNVEAIKNGPKKKTWNIHDLRAIQPMSDKQTDMFVAWHEGDNIIAHGSAGSGKTFIAFYLAMDELLDLKEHQEIIVVRSAVASRDIGHLPGSKEEKEAIFEIPYIDICQNLFGRKSTYEDMKEAGIIKFMTTSHIRGLTIDNAIIILDEVQNLSMSEINSVMTRVGKNTRVILCGDSKYQCDLKRGEQSGVKQLLEITHKMNCFSDVEFTHDDIVRSSFVKNWIIATESLVD